MKGKKKSQGAVHERGSDDADHVDVKVVDEDAQPAMSDADSSLKESGAGDATASTEAPAGASDASSQPSELETLKARISSLEDALLRTKADYQNLQRRTVIDRSEYLRYANADLMRSLLTVLDDFERALSAAGDSDNLQPVVDGVRLVQQNLLKSLSDAGLESIDALHQPFDPTVHEALLQQPTKEHPPGTVIDQVAKGYRLRERILRPAKVIVARGA